MESTPPDRQAAELHDDSYHRKLMRRYSLSVSGRPLLDVARNLYGRIRTLVKWRVLSGILQSFGSGWSLQVNWTANGHVSARLVTGNAHFPRQDLVAPAPLPAVEECAGRHILRQILYYPPHMTDLGQ